MKHYFNEKQAVFNSSLQLFRAEAMIKDQGGAIACIRNPYIQVRLGVNGFMSTSETVVPHLAACLLESRGKTSMITEDGFAQHIP